VRRWHLLINSEARGYNFSVPIEGDKGEGKSATNDTRVKRGVAEGKKTIVVR
jgi:hypothetical protein